MQKNQRVDQRESIWEFRQRLKEEAKTTLIRAKEKEAKEIEANKTKK